MPQRHQNVVDEPSVLERSTQHHVHDAIEPLVFGCVELFQPQEFLERDARDVLGGAHESHRSTELIWALSAPGNWPVPELKPPTRVQPRIHEPRMDDVGAQSGRKSCPLLAPTDHVCPIDFLGHTSANQFTFPDVTSFEG